MYPLEVVADADTPALKQREGKRRSSLGDGVEPLTRQ